MTRWIVILLPAVLIVVFSLVTWENRPMESTADSQSSGTSASPSRSHASDAPQHSSSPAWANAGTPSADPASRPAQDFEFPDIDTHPLLSSDYAQYDTNSLNQLVVAGDTMAMQVSALRLAREGNFADAVELMKGAAIHGARRDPFLFLARKASSELRRAAQGDAELSEQRRRAALIETLAYCKLAAMRGETQLADLMRRTLAERYGIEPSAEERDAIESRARAMYAEMQGRRQQLGLGPFDGAMTVN